MRILVVAGGSAATVFALAPLAAAARVCGHEVIMASTEDMMPVVAGAGFAAVPFTDLAIGHFITTDRAGRRLEIPEDPVEQLLFTGRWFARMALAGLPALRELAAARPPDVVVGGTMSYAAPLLARELGVPWVRQAWDISDPTLMHRGADEELADDLVGIGLTGLPEPAMWIDVCPPSLRRPDAPAATDMRWIPGNRQQRLEPWMYRRGARPRVCVTAGTRAHASAHLAELCALTRHATSLGAEAVVAAPDALAAALRAELGDEVRAGWLPLDVVAPTCDLVVHHAGGVTAMTALNAGVPQLMFPAGDAKAPAPAQRIVDAGAGLSLPDQADDDRVRSACEDLLRDPGYRAAAGRVAGEIADMPLPVEIVARFDGLAA